MGIAHGRSEECLRRRLPRSRSFRVHHFRGFDSLREKANPPVDLPQPPLAVLVVGVFTAIAVTSSPRHHLRHGAAFPGEQKAALIFEALQPARRYVVLGWCGGLVPLLVSGKTLFHLVVLPARIEWAPQRSQKMGSAIKQERTSTESGHRRLNRWPPGGAAAGGRRRMACHHQARRGGGRVDTHR